MVMIWAIVAGVPVVGGVGEWSLDKRSYYGAAPPVDLAKPPIMRDNE